MRDSTDVPDTSGLLERVTRERDAALALLELRTRERDAERERADAMRINTIGECIAAACGAESLTEAIDAIADLNGRGGGHG
jgi:hypothetical protein